MQYDEYKFAHNNFNTTILCVLIEGYQIYYHCTRTCTWHDDPHLHAVAEGDNVYVVPLFIPDLSHDPDVPSLILARLAEVVEHHVKSKGEGRHTQTIIDSTMTSPTNLYVAKAFHAVLTAYDQKITITQHN